MSRPRNLGWVVLAALGLLAASCGGPTGSGSGTATLRADGAVTFQRSVR
jgi:hypothetical protein